VNNANEVDPFAEKALAAYRTIPAVIYRPRPAWLCRY